MLRMLFLGPEGVSLTRNPFNQLPQSCLPRPSPEIIRDSSGETCTLEIISRVSMFDPSMADPSVMCVAYGTVLYGIQSRWREEGRRGGGANC
jgi:hypothetical protein